MAKHKHLILGSMPLFLVVFIDGSGLGLVFPILNAILIDPHVSILPTLESIHQRNLLYSFIIGIFMLCWFFGAAIISDLSDVIGRKRSLSICLVGSCLGYLLSGFAIHYNSISLLIVGRVIAGFTAGSQPVAQASIIDIVPPDKKTSYIGYVLLASNLGFILGPILGGVLSNSNYVSWFNFSVPMYVAAALSFVNLVMLMLLYKESFVVTKKVKIHVMRAVTLFVDAFKNKSIRYLSMVFFIYILAWANYYSFTPMFAMYRYGLSPTQTSFMMCLMSVGFVVGVGYLVGKVSTVFSRRNVIVYSLLIGAVLTMLLVIIHSALLMWILITPTATAVSIAYASILSLYSDQAGSDKQGWVMGVSGSILGLGYAVTDFISGFAVNLSYALPMIICATGLLVASLLMTKLFNK